MEGLEGIGSSRKSLKIWSGRPDSNRRRPAWENATTLILKDLANYCAHRVQWSFPSFQDLDATGITAESQNSAPHPKTTGGSAYPL